ncbi:MAG: NAD-binding protein [Nitrospirota bacterium]|nr:NAD-binding protein [Nitrospirota bacterium]
MADRVIIFGLSSIGIRIAEFLHNAGEEVLVAMGPEQTEVLGRLAAAGIRTACCDIKDPGRLDTLELPAARAIVLTSENEQFNLQAALHAVELNPHIRVVIRLFNLNLARKLEESVRNFRVLSVSQRASPSFTASSLLEDNLLSFETSKTILSFFRCPGRGLAGRTVRGAEQSDEIKIIAVNEALFPPGETSIGPDDRLVLFAKCSHARMIAGVSACSSGSCDRPARTWSLRRMYERLLGQDRVLLFILFAVLCLMGMGILMVRFEENLTFFNALYVILATLTSGGFEDTAFREFHPVTRVLFLLLMVSGVTLVAFLFAVVTDVMLKKRLDILMGRRRQKLREHVILCGVGDVGMRILEDLLTLGEKVVAIERNADGKFVQSVQQMNVPLIIADATLEESLLHANVGEARSIICATDDDMRNLEIGLNARSLHPDIRVVLRIFEKSFAEKIEKHFNIHVALSSSSIAAPAFASAATDMGIINTIKVNGVNCVVREILNDKGTPVGEGKGKRLAVVDAAGDVRFNDAVPREGERLIMLEIA